MVTYLLPSRDHAGWFEEEARIPGTHLCATRTPLPYEVGSFASTFLALVPAGLGALLGMGARRMTRGRGTSPG